jgi:hypothetical protein
MLAKDFLSSNNSLMPAELLKRKVAMRTLCRPLSAALDALPVGAAVCFKAG